MLLEAILRKEERSHHIFLLSLFLKKNAGFLGICTPAFNWNWANYFRQKHFQRKCSVFQSKTGILHCTLEALTSAVSAEKILILNIKIWFTTSLTHAASKKWRSLHVSFRAAAWQQVHFCLLSCFSFALLLNRNQKMTLRGTAHCNRCITHKYTETYRELWRIEARVIHKICQLHKIQCTKQK